MAYTLDVTVPTGITGLTDLRAQLFDTVGASVGVAVSTGFVEIGTSGTYNWHYTAWPDGHRGGVKFYSNADATNILAIASINPEEVEYTDAKTSSVAAGVWAILTSTLTTAGTVGKYIVDNLTAASGVWSHTASEPSSVPAANATMAAKLGWLFALARNKIIQTSTSQILYNDTDTNTIGTSAQSADNTSFYRDKWQ